MNTATDVGTDDLGPITPAVLAEVLRLAREHVALAADCISAAVNAAERTSSGRYQIGELVVALTALDRARDQININRGRLVAARSED